MNQNNKQYALQPCIWNDSSGFRTGYHTENNEFHHNLWPEICMMKKNVTISDYST